MFNKVHFSSVNSKALITMQMLHKKRKSWSKPEKRLSLSLFYKSPSTYKYIRKSGIVLPSESTMRRWSKSIDFLPGFIKEYLYHIKLKVSEMAYGDRKCIILHGEVSIMTGMRCNG